MSDGRLRPGLGLRRWIGDGWLSVDGLVLLCVAYLVAGPRIELVPVASSSIRLEDVVVLVLLVVAIVRGWSSLFSRLGPGMVIATAAVAISGIVSAAVGVLTGRIELIAGLLYVFRPIEYWIVLPAVVLGLRASRGRDKRITVMLATVTVLQVGVGVLQVAGLPIGFSKFTYERAAGLTAGPYELGAICAMLVCFWLFKRHYVLAAVAALGILISQSRISLAAVALGLVVLLIASWGRVLELTRVAWKRRPRLFLAVALGLVAAAGVVLVFLGRPLLHRLTDTGIISAWADARRFSDSVPVLRTAHEYAVVAFDRIDRVLGGATIDDVSNVVRFFRWQLLIAALLAPPIALLFGLGPSFAGPSVDGAFLRIVVEFGLVGLIAWTFWFYQSVRRAGVWILGVLATLLVGSTTIDLLFALRPMVLFWCLAAVARIENPWPQRPQRTGEVDALR